MFSLSSSYLACKVLDIWYRHYFLFQNVDSLSVVRIIVFTFICFFALVGFIFLIQHWFEPIYAPAVTAKRIYTFWKSLHRTMLVVNYYFYHYLLWQYLSLICEIQLFPLLCIILIACEVCWFVSSLCLIKYFEYEWCDSPKHICSHRYQMKYFERN